MSETVQPVLRSEALQRFYCEAAAKTFASGLRPQTVSGQTGAKTYFYEQKSRDGHFQYADVFYSNGRRSFGTTCLYAPDCYGDDPVWYMQYHGEEVSPNPLILEFLKLALRNNYDRGIFNAGRGPSFYNLENSSPLFPDIMKKYGHIQYVLEAFPFEFASFRGVERIRDSKLHVLFWHEIRGGTLVPLE